MRHVILLGLVLLLQACAAKPSIGTEQYRFEKMVTEQRAQCRLLPEPLASSCLEDVKSKNYQDFVKQKKQE